MNNPNNPYRVGSAISVADSTALAALDPTGLTLGTDAYNASLAASFTLTLSSAALVTDQIVAVSGIDGYRWILNQGGSGSIPLSELAAQAAHTFVGNATAGSASPTAITAAAAAAILPAASTALQGVMPPIVTFPQAWISAPIDFMTVGIYPVGPPLQAAGIFAVLNRQSMPILITSRTGTVTTGPQFKIGNNATHDNICPAAAPSAANLNVTPPAPITGIALNSPQPQLLDASNQYYLEVTVAAVGSTVLTGRLMFESQLTPITIP